MLGIILVARYLTGSNLESLLTYAGLSRSKTSYDTLKSREANLAFHNIKYSPFLSGKIENGNELPFSSNTTSKPFNPVDLPGVQPVGSTDVSGLQVRQNIASTDQVNVTKEGLADRMDPEKIQLPSGANKTLLTEQDIAHWNTQMIEPLSISSMPALKKKPLAAKNFGIKPAHSKPGNLFSISILQGFGISSLSFAPGDQVAEEMHELITSSTRSLESFNTSLRGRFDLANGIAVSGGISFGSLTTETTYAYSRTERSSGEGTSSIIIDDTGQQYLVTGNVGATRYIDLEATRYTHHQSLGFELLVHKTLLKIKRANISGFLKGGYNAWYTAEGTAFTEEKVPVAFTSNENPFRLDSPWTYGFGLDVQYHIAPKWTLSGALGYDRKNIYHQDYAQLKWKQSIYSLTLGVGYVL
jgi:hypothetical protein